MPGTVRIPGPRPGRTGRSERKQIGLSPAERFSLSLSFLAGGKGKERFMRRLGNESQGIEEFFDDDGGVLSDHPHVHGFLPDDHPHPQLYHGVTPIGMTANRPKIWTTALEKATHAASVRDSKGGL